MLIDGPGRQQCTYLRDSRRSTGRSQRRRLAIRSGKCNQWPLAPRDVAIQGPATRSGEGGESVRPWRSSTFGLDPSGHVGTLMPEQIYAIENKCDATKFARAVSPCP